MGKHELKKMMLVSYDITTEKAAAMPLPLSPLKKEEKPEHNQPTDETKTLSPTDKS